MNRSNVALALALLTCIACAEQSPPAAPSALDRIESRCRDENPIDPAERDACIDTHIGNQRRAAEQRQTEQRRRARPAAPTVYAPVAVAAQDFGQSLQAFGRQLAAPPVRCTSLRMGVLTSTTCR